MLWFSVGFVLGLSLGFSLGVLAYLATYSVFQKENEQRTRKRIALASNQAAIIAREQANRLHKMRSLHGQNLNDATNEVDPQMEEILGTGPNGGARK